MNCHWPNNGSLEAIESMNAEGITVPDMSRSHGFAPGIEIIDAPELARRLRVPVSWVRQRATSPRFSKEERIPHIRFGRYIRFLWGSPELNAWLAEHFEQ
jgi:hypothetical protein